MQRNIYKAAEHHQLHIHEDEKGDIWVKAIWTFASITDRIVEHLFCLDKDKSIFELTERKVQGTVSITILSRRHNQFPIHCKVRMEACS